MKLLQGFYKTISRLPLLAYLTYYSYIFRVMICQGKNAFVEDPTSLGYKRHNQLVWWALDYTIYGVSLWFLITCIIYFTPFKSVLITKNDIKIFFLGSFLCLCWFIDPFMSWFLD